MSAETRYRIAQPEVLHELLDGEVVLIHFGRGIYFGLSGSGTLMFKSLVEGASESELIAFVMSRTDADTATATTAVTRLLGELLEHELIQTYVDGDANRRPEPEYQGEKCPFEAPRLEAFTDLQDLLAADPIHDVKPAGWPHLK